MNFSSAYTLFLNLKVVDNKSVRIVQSNFPDSLFLPLVVSLFGNSVPELILFIEGEEFLNNTKLQLINWVNKAIFELNNKKYDYIFGNHQIIDNKKIGCSLLISKASIIQHLLYYTDSDTTHLNPFYQLSLANQTIFSFIQFNNSIKTSNLENIQGKLSQCNMSINK